MRLPDPVLVASRLFDWRRLLLVIVVFGALHGCAGVGGGGDPVVLKRAQLHMGTVVSITAVAARRETAQEATQAGFQEIRRLEQLLSTWRPDSELSQVNASAGRRPVRVSQETFELVSRSLDFARMTGGGFNIAVGPAVEAWSVTERQQIPTVQELERLHPLVDWRAIQLDEGERTIFLPHFGMRIDIGGIGKGYAADRAAEVMQQAGAQGGVVALSGDITTCGSLPEQAGFSVGIRHPRREGVLLARINLKNEAISTAGDYERYFERDGIRYHHILDPLTLQPAWDCQSVTVVASDGITADGLDTGLFVMGRERAMALIESLPGVGAIIVDRDGKVWVSSRLQGRVQMGEATLE
ncbi:MAG: FAD:protein FMN transferase [Nitrospiraceae bacterium]